MTSDRIDSTPREIVVLVPGILELWIALGLLGRRLAGQGFDPTIHRYPSTRRWIEEHADALHAALDRRTDGFSRPFHLVGHSMGGLVIRACLARHGRGAASLPGLGRVAFLGTPHHGARLASVWGDRWIYRAVFGTKAGQQLRPEASFFATTPAPAVPFGTIAGARGGSGGTGDGASDRLVEVASTRLAGEADWMLVRADHHGMVYRRDVAEAVGRFLRTGRFRGAD